MIKSYYEEKHKLWSLLFLFLFKISYLPFLVIDDVRRFIVRLKKKTRTRQIGRGVLHTPSPADLSTNHLTNPDTIPRSEFLMKAGLQDSWEHRIAKSTKVMKGRINLTFRLIR